MGLYVEVACIFKQEQNKTPFDISYKFHFKLHPICMQIMVHFQERGKVSFVRNAFIFLGELKTNSISSVDVK